MKPIKKFSIGMLFLTICSFLISFSQIALAEEKPSPRCIESCKKQKITCYNIHVDKRICEAEYEKCVDTCNQEEDSNLPEQQKEEAK